MWRDLCGNPAKPIKASCELLQRGFRNNFRGLWEVVEHANGAFEVTAVDRHAVDRVGLVKPLVLAKALRATDEAVLKFVNEAKLTLTPQRAQEISTLVERPVYATHGR